MTQAEIDKWMEKFLDLDEDDFLAELELLPEEQQDEISKIILTIFKTSTDKR
jgi:hypothetical protein